MTLSNGLPIKSPMTEDTKKVCEILGIDPDTPDDEVDKAYSAMMAGWYTTSDHRTKEKLIELTNVYQRALVHRDPRINNDRSPEQRDAIYTKKDPMVDIIAQSHDRSSTSQSFGKKEKRPTAIKREKRPTAITVICVISFLGVLFPVLIFFFSPLARQIFAQQFGAWSLSYMAFSTIAGLVCTVGLWLMKKWAAYAYIGLAAVNLAVGLAAGQSDIWTSLIAAIIIFFALKHVAKMT
jgi:VIT1/CCC1 family predicted Fe2+/Mn2+ transporter